MTLEKHYENTVFKISMNLEGKMRCPHELEEQLNDPEARDEMRDIWEMFKIGKSCIANKSINFKLSVHCSQQRY